MDNVELLNSYHKYCDGAGQKYLTKEQREEAKKIIPEARKKVKALCQEDEDWQEETGFMMGKRFYSNKEVLATMDNTEDWDYTLEELALDALVDCMERDYYYEYIG